MATCAGRRGRCRAEMRWSLPIAGPVAGPREPPKRRVGGVGLDAPARDWGSGAGAGGGGGGGSGDRNTQGGFGKPLATLVHKVIS